MAKTKTRESSCLKPFWYEHVPFPGVSSSAEALRKVSKEIQRLPRRLDSLDATSLSRIVLMFGLVQDEYFKKNKKPQLAWEWKHRREEWFDVATLHIHNFNENALTNSVYGLCLFRETIPVSFQNTIFSALNSKRKTLTPRHYSKIFFAAGKLGLSLSESLVQTAANKFQDFTATDLSQTMYGLGRIGKRLPDGFIERFAEANSAKINDYSAKGLVDAFWGLAVASVTTPISPEMKEIGQTLLERLKTENLPIEESHACHHACLRLFPKEAKHFALSRQREMPSLSEKVFLPHLLSAGLRQSEPARSIPELAVFVDYAFICGNNEVLMEFDGPHHFMNRDSTSDPSGPTLLMSSLIRQVRPKDVLVRISNADAEALSTKAKTHLLEPLSKMFREMDPGAYRMKHNGDGIYFEPLLEETAHASPPRPRVQSVTTPYLSAQPA